MLFKVTCKKNQNKTKQKKINKPKNQNNIKVNRKNKYIIQNNKIEKNPIYIHDIYTEIYIKSI